MSMRSCAVLVSLACLGALLGCSSGQEAGQALPVCANEYGTTQDGDLEIIGGVAFTHRFVEVAGICWHYAKAGRGEPVVFLHGLPESWYSWHHQMEDLAADHEVLALDLKGYGQSGKADGSYRVDAMAEEFVSLFDTIGLRSFNIVSHDWGTAIADFIAGNHPDRILGYVRMQAPVLVQDIGDRPQFLLFKNQALATALMSNADLFVRFVYDRMTVQPVAEEDLARIILEFGRPGVAEAVPRYFRDIDLLAAFSGILLEQRKALFARMEFPVLLLQATSDPNQPQWYYDGATGAFPQAALQWVEDCGHFSELEQPDAVTGAIRSFLGRR